MENSPYTAGGGGNLLGKWHLLAQLLCSVRGTCYEPLLEQRLGPDGCLVYPIHHSQVLRSSGAVLTAV